MGGGRGARGHRAVNNANEHGSCQADAWPPRPQNEVFPELMDTLLVAQLLLYDRRRMTPEQARRNVRKLVKESGLPTLGRIGSTLMYNKAAVLDWLASRGDGLTKESLQCGITARDPT